MKPNRGFPPPPASPSRSGRCRRGSTSPASPPSPPSTNAGYSASSTGRCSVRAISSEHARGCEAGGQAAHARSSSRLRAHRERNRRPRAGDDRAARPRRQLPAARARDVSADHLASGLVPVAILAAVAAVYPRLPPAVRAATAMTFGAIGLAFGFPGAYHLLDDGVSGDDYTGLLAILAGVVLLVSAPVILWKARRSDGSRRRRYLRRTLATVVGAVPVSRSSSSSSSRSASPTATRTSAAPGRCPPSASPTRR